VLPPDRDYPACRIQMKGKPMQTEKPNGYPVARPADSALNDGLRSQEQRFMEHADGKGTVQPLLLRVVVALILAVAKDIRDRTTPDYRDFFDRLVADIRERGVQVPLIAYREGERLRVIDGETRRLAALMAGAETVPVLVYDQKPNDAALKLAQLLANSLRRDNTPLELAAVYQELMRLNDWTQADLARHVRVSPAQVVRVLAISTKLPGEVQAMVAAGELAPRAAYALSRLSDIPTVIDLAKKARDLPMAVESVEEAVKKLLGNGRKAKAKPLKLKLDGVQIVANNPTLDGLQAFAERLLAALKRLAKEGDGIEFLPARLKGT
jgi:ParB/RepB/Spo0J family partition protein